jgi:hypothetical protein
MLYKRKNHFSEFGIFTDEDIPTGQLLFSHDDWVSDEQYGWSVLRTEEIHSLPMEDKKKFLRYSYDIDYDLVIGTFDWENAKHISNFMNHSCNPNMIYDLNDNIIARRDIIAGEELTIDYGNFIVNMDQEFTCSCGAEQCRKHILKDDWKKLIGVYGLNFPKFMHAHIKPLLKN